MNTDKKIPVIAFTSGKGGCGKTTIAINFAYSLYRASKSNKVLVVDLDISNKGSTGVFSTWTSKSDDFLTITQILKSNNNKPPEKEVIEVENGFYFIPASVGNEEIWKEPVEYDLNFFVKNLRSKLIEIGTRLGIDCIVLDCFCGIDLLTTAGSGSADHTIIINEPDIVTFTGSLNLKKHLDKSFVLLDKKPKLHFVINRVRSEQKVADLQEIYKDNLLKDVNNDILTYIPFNNRIFAHFGSYPFFIKLLPKSLFTLKIEQIAYVLFIQSNPKLVRPKTRQWSEKKFRKIYFESIDKTAVDTEYLLVKLVSAPVVIGLIIVALFWITGIFRFTPVGASILVLVTAILIAYIFFTRIFSATVLMARFHFTLASFLYRLGLNSRFRGSSLKELIKAFVPLSAGLFISVTITIVMLTLLSVSIVVIDEKYFLKQAQPIDLLVDTKRVNDFIAYSDVDNNAMFENYSKLLGERFPQTKAYKSEVISDEKTLRPNDADYIYTGLELPYLKLDLSNSTITNVDFDTNGDFFYSWKFFSDATEFLRTVKFRNTEFDCCKLPTNFLNEEIFDCTFSYCNFNTQSPSYVDIEDRFVHADLKPIFQNNVHTTSSGIYSNVTINGLVSDGIFFDNCIFNDLTINLNANRFIALKECEIKNLRINHLGEGGPCYVYVENHISELIQIGENVEIRNLSEFKNLYYWEVYSLLDVQDKQISLYESIISYENALQTIEFTNKLRSLKNLTESYMMTYDTVFYTRLDELFVELGKEIKINQIETNNFVPEIPSDVGIYYMLLVYFKILNNNTDEINVAFNKYKSWIYDHADQGIERKLGLWEFNVWNEYMGFNADKLSEHQIYLFDLIQKMGFSDRHIDEYEANRLFTNYLRNQEEVDYETKLEQITTIYYDNERMSKLKKR